MLEVIRQVARVRPTNLFSSYITRQQQSLQIRKRIFSTEATSKTTSDTSKAATRKATPTEVINKELNNSKDVKEESPKKKRIGIGKFIFGITLFGGITYGGSIYYSLKNEDFRDDFTEYVYGAKKSIEYVEDLQRKGIFDSIENKSKIAVDKVIQIFRPTPTVEPDTTEKSTKDILLNKDQKLVEIKKLQSSENPILLKLTNTLNELINILISYDVKDKDHLIKRAREELKELETHIDLLNIEKEAKIQYNIDEQNEKFNQQFALKEYELKQQFEDEKHRLYEQHYEQLKNELARESAKHNENLKNALFRQAVEMQRRWIRDVKAMVEQERGGRLARLDNINHKLKLLERISVDNTERLDNSLKAHKLWCALRSLQDAVEQPRNPFANQLIAIKHLFSSDEVLTTVLSTIDDNVANNGVESISDLSARFAIVREEVRRASLVPENGGVLAHLISYMFSKILFRKHGLVKGSDVESILARVQFYLNENDLDTATRELNQLKGWPKKLAEDWIKAARNHLEIKQAIEIIETQATLSSLSVA